MRPPMCSGNGALATASKLKFTRRCLLLGLILAGWLVDWCRLTASTRRLCLKIWVAPAARSLRPSKPRAKASRQNACLSSPT
jgi:hypothetical protein